MLCLFLIMTWAKNTHKRLNRKALIWYIEVFTVVQYGNQMYIMNVHNHEWSDSFSSYFMNFLCPLKASHLSFALWEMWKLHSFVPEISLGYENLILYILLHIHPVTVPGGSLSHKYNIFSRSYQKISSFQIITWFYSFDMFLLHFYYFILI